jgi:hypothetical protein
VLLCLVIFTTHSRFRASTAIATAASATTDPLRAFTKEDWAAKVHSVRQSAAPKLLQSPGLVGWQSANFLSNICY